mgnify:CR=1 FL=1
MIFFGNCIAINMTILYAINVELKKKNISLYRYIAAVTGLTELKIDIRGSTRVIAPVVMVSVFFFPAGLPLSPDDQ